ncbi:MAG: hypothetical protein ACE5GT_09760, partial [Rhodospirillales bacterium]
MPTFTFRQGRFNTLIWGVLFAIAPIFVADPLAGGGKWIVDETNQCGTSNPFLVPGERIRWHGPCANGKLNGAGTLIWYQGNRETERNEGSFRNGEFHGNVVTTFPDGQIVYGQYVNGIRHGDFVIVRVDGRPVGARYEKGVLKSQNAMTDADVAEWQRNRGKPRAPATTADRRRLSDRELRPQAMASPRAAPPAPAPRAAPPPQPAGDPRSGDGQAGEKESSSWWSLGGMWSYLNPAEWSVVDKVTRLFGFGSDEDEPAPGPAPAPTQSAAATRPPPAPTQPAAVPRPAPAPTQQALAPARVQAPASRPPPPQRPAARPGPYGVSQEEVARNWEGTTKNWYDMSVFLNESHPFATTPDAKATMPIVNGRVGAPIDYGGAANAIQPQLADGWHLASPDPIRPVAMTYAPPSVPQQQYPDAADALFTRAFQLERTGNYAGAKNLYEQIVMRHPSVPSANLANDRLNAMNRAATRNAAATLAPRTDYVTIKPGDQVIAVNSPVPPYSPDDGSAGGGVSPVHDSPYISKRVCSRRGLYDGDARWCGVVRRDNGGHLVVEVRDVQLKSFGMVGISRSTCTGGAFLTWFSR